MGVLLQFPSTQEKFNIEILSLYCPVCKKIQNMPSNFEYESLKADHFVILKALPRKMEIIGASRIFLRSEKIIAIFNTWNILVMVIERGLFV